MAIITLVALPLLQCMPCKEMRGRYRSVRIVEENVIGYKGLKELLSKGAVVEVTNPWRGFYSNLFLVPKKDGGQRPVINLKSLNSFVQTQHFKMEGIHTLSDLIHPGDWLATVDLKDAYFAVPIHHSHHQYLRFNFQGKCYQLICLPFGLSSAPWGFTKTLKPALALLREMGVRLIAYIDDILVLAESQELAKNHVEGVVDSRFQHLCNAHNIQQSKPHAHTRRNCNCARNYHSRDAHVLSLASYSSSYAVTVFLPAALTSCSTCRLQHGSSTIPD